MPEYPSHTAIPTGAEPGAATIRPTRPTSPVSPALPVDRPLPVWSAGPVTLYTGDACAVLAGLPDSSVDCVVTSPPYWGLRDYRTGGWTGGRASCPQHNPAEARAARQARQTGRCPACGAMWTDLQHGLETELGDYVARLVAAFDQIHRVLRPTGTAWLNLGDCYASGETGRRDTNLIYPGLGAQQAPRPDCRVRQRSGLPTKNLLGMPWRVAFALQQRGWWLRNAIVWAKPNPMPESVTDRLSATYEMLFLLTRSPRYHFDLDAIRVPHAGTTTTSAPRAPSSREDAGAAANGRRVKYTGQPPELAGRQHGAAMLAGRTKPARHPLGKNPGDVWRLATRPLREAHFAAFPIDIPRRCIAAGSPAGGVVLDPFCGAGTTGLAALELGRSFLGVDLNPDYTALTRRRLAQHLPAGDRDADQGGDQR